MPRGDGTTHSGASGSSAASSTVGVHAAWRALEPARRAASVPAATPSVRHACSAKLPLAAPAEHSACTGAPGTKHALTGSKRGRPPACAWRCTTGLQPPDIATRSHGSVRTGPAAMTPRVSSAMTSTALTRFVPRVSTTTAWAITSMPALRTRSGNSPFGARRASTTAATAMPAAARRSAVR